MRIPFSSIDGFNFKEDLYKKFYCISNNVLKIYNYQLNNFFYKNCNLLLFFPRK